MVHEIAFDVCSKQPTVSFSACMILQRPTLHQVWIEGAFKVMDVARPAARSTRARALAAPEAHSAALSTKENSVGRGAVASAASAQGKGYQASPLRPHNAQPLKANAGDNIAKPESKAAGAKAAPEPEVLLDTRLLPPPRELQLPSLAHIHTRKSVATAAHSANDT